MSILKRRVQLLLDDDRYERVRRRAERTGASAGAVIREAIDVGLAAEDDEAARRRAAGERLLAESPPAGREPDWEQVKEEMLDSLYDRLPRQA